MQTNLSNEIVNTRTAEHYTWGAGCDGWHLVTRAELSCIQERIPPGASEERHYHAKARHFFYVIAGELTIEVDDRLYTMSSGDGLEIRPQQRHQVMNRSGEDVRILVISQPESHGDRLAAGVSSTAERYCYCSGRYASAALISQLEPSAKRSEF